MALGVASGVLGFWGYHLYETKQTPMEWGKAVVDEAWMQFEDAADPSEEFIRNSVQVRPRCLQQLPRHAHALQRCVWVAYRL